LQQRKKVSKNVAASEKIAKNQFIPLKENNSPAGIGGIKAMIQEIRR